MRTGYLILILILILSVLKKIINATAADYNGISGNIVLNAAGDRINANYDTQSPDDHENYVWKQNIEGNYSQSNN